MAIFTVTFEDVAFTSLPKARDPIEMELTEQELIGISETMQAEKTFPPGVTWVSKVYATPDDSVYKNGRRDGEVKLFVSVDLLIEAADEEAAEAFDPPVDLLTKLVDMLPEGAELHLERQWESLMAEAAESPAPAA